MKTILIIFCLACSGHLLAQTTVCSGDSVALVLDGYKQGDISWKQSPDKTTWSSASGTQYKDSLAFTATNTLYYRAFVINGTCSPFYSDTTLVIVNPTPPIAKPATGITQTSFTANWSTVAGATDYFLDVATNAVFTSFVPGYRNVDISTADTTYPISGLSCLTTYYYRVRDSSDACTTTSVNSNTISVTTDSCPPPTNCGIITDTRDGKTYKTIIIGTQCWMAQNLNVGKAIAGEVSQTPGADNQNGSIEKYCYGYTHRVDTSKIDSIFTDSSKCATYGGLYKWNEMMAYGTSVTDPKGQGICPTGWHIPTDDEWTILVDYLGGTTTAGGKMKDISTHLWKPYTISTNSSGFSALPSGYCGIAGAFDGVGNAAYFWAATEYVATTYAWRRYLYYDDAQVYRDNSYEASFGFSVRCVKD